jgi:hypothetical protein
MHRGGQKENNSKRIQLQYWTIARSIPQGRKGEFIQIRKKERKKERRKGFGSVCCLSREGKNWTDLPAGGNNDQGSFQRKTTSDGKTNTLCGCGDDRHFSIKQPLLLTPHLSPSPKQTQKEKENNTKKKIKEKKIISVSFVFVYPPLPPSSSDTIVLCHTASPITKLRDLFAPDGEADGGVRSTYQPCITCLQGPDQCWPVIRMAVLEPSVPVPGTEAQNLSLV